MDQVIVRPSENGLGLLDPVATVDDVAAYLRHVPFEPAMIAICRLQAMAWHIARDGQAQLALAREFFGEVVLLDRFEIFLKRHENGVLFGEQDFFLLQRLLIEYARDGQLDAGMTPAEFDALKAATLRVRSVVDTTDY